MLAGLGCAVVGTARGLARTLVVDLPILTSTSPANTYSRWRAFWASDASGRTQGTRASGEPTQLSAAVWRRAACAFAAAAPYTLASRLSSLPVMRVPARQVVRRVKHPPRR
jgi:hypothetical protein